MVQVAWSGTWSGDDYTEDVRRKGAGVRDERAHKGVARRHPPLGVPSPRRGGLCLRTAPLACTLRAPTNTYTCPRLAEIGPITQSNLPSLSRYLGLAGASEQIVVACILTSNRSAGSILQRGANAKLNVAGLLGFTRLFQSSGELLVSSHEQGWGSAKIPSGLATIIIGVRAASRLLDRW